MGPPRSFRRCSSNPANRERPAYATVIRVHEIKIRPFQIATTEEDLLDLRRRLAKTRWPEPATLPDWSQGVPLDDLQELCAYWRTEYDWRAGAKPDPAIPPCRAPDRRLLAPGGQGGTARTHSQQVGRGLKRPATERMRALMPAIRPATPHATAVPDQGRSTLAARTRSAATPIAVPS